jgi:hypothetical protein
LFSTGKPEQEQLRLAEELGLVDLDELCASLPRLKKAQNLVERHRFLHWELEFGDLFEDRGGFDLILGNPPWVKVEWNEGGVIGDFEPLFVLHKMSAPDLNRLRGDTMRRIAPLRAAYLDEYVEFQGLQNFLNATENYPLLLGSQANLYKCFIVKAWDASAMAGIQAFVHPDGVYDDPKGGRLRVTLYPRLRLHFHFRNECQLFVGANDHGRLEFGVSVYSEPRDLITFSSISNLFHPATADASFDHSGQGSCGGIKDDGGNWNLSGHKSRIIEVDEQALGLFASIYDAPGTPPLAARLPNLHTGELVSVLEKFASYPHRLGHLEDSYETTMMWDEANACKTGIIRRETQFPTKLEQWILSGPHIGLGTPLAKTPRRICTEKVHYDVLDITQLPGDYIPRTNYVSACDPDTYRSRSPRVHWGAQSLTTSYYRLVARSNLSQAAERTLIAAICPPSVGHIDAIYSVAFEKESNLLAAAAMCCSLPADFFIKSTGHPRFRSNLARQVPIFQGPHCVAAAIRVLLLNCLLSSYQELWERCWQREFTQQNWSKTDRRLDRERFLRATRQWHWQTPFRTDYERRQALVEIDVLAALNLGLSLEELCLVYRIQFPVLRGYEQNTWYDQNGRIVYLDGDTAYGFATPHWREIKGMTEGVFRRTIDDDTQPGGPRERVIEYVAPFDRCDREADYATAWKFFNEVNGQ